jgi:AbrB family looped-hinge helix DNA binding protein
MFMYQSKIGKKYQTVVPMEVRESAGIQEGDSLLWEVHEEGYIVVRPQKSKTEHLARLHKKIYGSATTAEQHIKSEQEGWNP